MPLAKSGYSDANQGTTKTKVLIDGDGNLVSDTTLATGTKNFSINSVSAENGLTDNVEVINFFMGLANAVASSDTNTMSVNWGV